MNIEVGYIYFISNTFFDWINDESIPINKPKDENGKDHNRPVYCVIKFDKEDIYWVIPISTKVKKYKRIYNRTKEKYGRCDTIQFGLVNGRISAFLIQNIFPVSPKYIENIYKDYKTGEPLEISGQTKKELHKKANKVLSLYKRKHIKLMYTNIDDILEKLIDEDK